MKKIKEYAIELSLVIVGVLIAMTVDNYREKNRNQKIIDSYLEMVSLDLEDDILRLKKQLTEDSITLSILTQAVDRLDAGNYDSLDRRLYQIYEATEFTMKNSGYQMIVNSGQGFLAEASLIKSLNDYYIMQANVMEATSKIDYDFNMMIIGYLTPLMGDFEKNLKTNLKFNITELRNVINGRWVTVFYERKHKVETIEMAKALVKKMRG